MAKKHAPTSEQFRQARLAARLTQKQAAELLRVPIGTLQGWEQGRFSGEWVGLELLLLKTGQFKLHDWKSPAKLLQPGRLRLKLASGAILTLNLRAEAFKEFSAAVAREAGK